MITIETRQNKYGKWWCNCTNVSDISFESGSIKDSQQLMKNYLQKEKIPLTEQKWEEPKYYPVDELKNRIEQGRPYGGFHRPKIDNSPFA